MVGWQRVGSWLGAMLVALAIGVVVRSAPAHADGTEGLGPPSIDIADGDAFVGDGVGLFGTEPGSGDPGGSRPVTVDVPAGAVVEQVLVYWEGQSSTPGGGDSTIVVDGTEVTGVAIGGPTAVGQVFTQTYRADISSLGVLAPGSNTITLGGLAFDRKNSGAGIFAILTTGEPATIQMVDGNDFAFFRFDPPLDTTTPITVTFPTTAEATTGQPLLFVSSVDDERPRSSVIRFTFDTGEVVEFDNALMNSNGDEWDTFDDPVPVPAGASSATVQILSQLPTGQTTGPLPASLVWNLAAVAIPQQVGGSLQVAKTISGATEGHVPGTSFTVAIDCDGDQFDTTADIGPGGPPASITGIPPGTSCTVTETGVPDPAPGFEYGTPSYSPSQTVVVEGDVAVEVIVDNPISPLGTLDVVKTISGATEGYDPGTSFTVAIDCDGDQFDTTVEITPDGGPATIGPLPDGTTCTVTETGVPDALPDHGYGPPTYTPGQTVIVDGSASVTIDNPVEELSIELAATALCVNDTPYLDYDVDLGAVQAPDGVTVRFRNVSTGVIEDELIGQPTSGRLLWPGAEVGEDGEPVDWPGWEFVDGEWIEVDDGLRPEIDVIVEVNPEATVRVDYPPPLPNCDPNPSGGLQVVKTIVSGGAAYVEGSQFSFTLRCSDPTFDDDFTLVDGGRFVKEQIAVGTECTVTETGRPQPRDGWTWAEPRYSPAQTVTIIGDAELLEVEVLNTATNGGIPQTGTESVDLGLLGLILLTLGGVLVATARVLHGLGSR